MGLNRLPVTAPRSANDLIFLRQRFIEGAERPSDWPDIESAGPGDAPKAVQILGQAGQAYIHTLKSLLEETQGYLPDELASRIAERCAFTDIQWSRDVSRVEELVRGSAQVGNVLTTPPPPISPRKRKSPPHRPAESEGWPEDDVRFYRYLSRLIRLPLDQRSDVALYERTGLPQDQYYVILVAISAKAAPQLGSWAQLKDPRVPNKLSPAGSAQVLRVARVFVRAVLLFGTRPPAAKWMLQPQPWPDRETEQSPLTRCAHSEDGARQVEQQLACATLGLF